MTPPSHRTDDRAHDPGGDGGRVDARHGTSASSGEDAGRGGLEGSSRSRKPRGIASYPPDRS